MKYKFTSLLIALLCSIINVYAQNEIVINGIVRDRINKNILGMLPSPLQVHLLEP